ncbi:8468_t:CDS:2, partial [Entrophospora sp. SA101]
LNNFNKDQQLYGILPYIAPEMLYGDESSKSSDIYSIGIIMWQICFGRVMERCWNANINNRSNIDELFEIASRWK